MAPVTTRTALEILSPIPSFFGRDFRAEDPLVFALYFVFTFVLLFLFLAFAAAFRGLPPANFRSNDTISSSDS